MSNQTPEQRLREEFEEAYYAKVRVEPRGWLLKRTASGDYYHREVRIAWLGYQLCHASAFTRGFAAGLDAVIDMIDARRPIPFGSTKRQRSRTAFA